MNTQTSEELFIQLEKSQRRVNVKEDTVMALSVPRAIIKNLYEKYNDQFTNRFKANTSNAIHTNDAEIVRGQLRLRAGI